MKVALVTTPSERSGGIGDYTRSLLVHLRELVELELYSERAMAGGAIEGLPLRPIEALVVREQDRILYQLGNVGAQAFMLPWIARYGGAVALHDWVLFDLVAAAHPELERGGLAGHLCALREGGLRALAIYARNRRSSGRQLSADRFELPFPRAVVRRADAFVVHSQSMRERILLERRVPTPIAVLPHGAAAAWREGERRETRAALGLSPAWREAFLLVSFGAVQQHKRIEPLLQALALARRERPALRLVLAGALACEGYPLEARLAELGLAQAVLCTGYLPDERAEDYLHAADLCVNLRGPSTGGTSGGIQRAFSLGRGVLASDLAEQRELPDDCVIRIPVGGEEVELLARTLVRLHDAPEERAALEAGARRYVREDCHWPLVARRYVEALERFPDLRGNRPSLIRSAVDAADRRRRELEQEARREGGEA